MAGTVTETVGVETRPDAELISAVRSGDNAAYGILFDRHRAAAERLARQLVRGPDADDLVAESFTRVLVILQNGKGPDESFRAYLLTAMRRFHIDRIRSGSRVRSTGDEQELDRAVEWVDPAEMRFETGAAAQAFAELPERWQTVLWHLDVEGHKPADVAPLLGMSPNSVSALAYRAREGLRQAYLQQHLAVEQRETCRHTTEYLGAYVRDGLSARAKTKVESHLDECARCMGLYLELREVNSNLGAWLAPALLGSAAAGYLSATTAATAGGALVAVKGGLAHALAPVKALGPAGTTAAAGVATVAVVAAVAVAATQGGGQPDVPSASGTAGTTAEPAPVQSDPTPQPTPTTGVEDTEPADEVSGPAEPVVEPLPQPTADRPDPGPTNDRPTDPTPPSQRPTPASPAPQPPVMPRPTAGDGLLDIELLGLHLGTLGGGQLVSIGLTHSDRPAVVVLRYDDPASLIGTVSPGWTCYQDGRVIRCVGERTRAPLYVMVKSAGRPLVTLGS